MPQTPETWLDELTVNTVTIGAQTDPDVIQLANGNILVAWTSYQDTGAGSPSGSDIIARIFDPLGNPVSGEFRLNTFSTVTEEFRQALAPTNDGGFIVVYEDMQSGVSSILFDRFDASGTRLNGGYVQQDTSGATPSYRNPDVAVNANNLAFATFVLDQASFSDAVQYKVFNASTGTPGGFISAISTSTGTIGEHEVTALAGGGFVVVAHINEDAGSSFDSIQYKVFDPFGSALTGQLAVASTASDSDFDFDPSVIGLAGGGFAIAWRNQDSTDDDIAVRVYDAAGNDIGGGRVGSSIDDHNEPSLVALADGTFIVLFDDDGNDQLLAQRYSATGSKIGTVFAYESQNSALPVGTGLADGRAAVAFQDGGTGEISLEILDTRDNANPDAVYTPGEWQVGTIGNDNFIADSGADFVYAYDGDDTVQASGIVKTYDLGAGDDFLSVTSLINSDVYIGGAGNDWIDWQTLSFTGAVFDLAAGKATAGVNVEPMTGFENIYASKGNDRVIGTTGPNQILAMAGADTVEAGSGNDIVLGLEGNDSLLGEIGNDTLEGGDGDDLLDGGGSIDSLSGGDGNDTLLGGFSNDTLDGGAGNDLFIIRNGEFIDDIVGGTGTDALDASDETGTPISVTLNSTWAGLGGTRSITGIEHVIGTQANDTLDADNINGVTLDGFDGGDSLVGGFGSQTLLGGDGNDTIDGGFAAGSSASDRLEGGSGNDSINGANAGDVILGDSGNDTLRGNGGNDHIQGGTGGDSLWGGSGNDTLAGELGADTVFGDGGNDLILSIDADTVDGGAGDDTIDAVLGGFSIGNSGDDVFRLKTAAVSGSMIEGEGGFDTFDMSGSNFSALVADLAAETFSLGSTVYSTLGDIERVLGSQNDDEITGNDAANTLQGNAGDDTISGGLGNDTLSGGTGDDSIAGGEGDDTIESGLGADTLDGGAGADRLIIDEGFTEANGGNGDDVFLFSGNANPAFTGDFDGDSGTDTLLLFVVGSSALDRPDLDFSSIEKLVFEDLGDGAGTRSVELGAQEISSSEISLSATIEGIDATGFIERIEINMNVPTSLDLSGWTFTNWGLQGETIQVNGDDAAEHITGSLAQDNLYGAGGNDSLNGFNGDDGIWSGTGDDFVLGGAGFDSMWGDTGEDTLLGEVGNDIMWGMKDNDLLNGGNGEDTGFGGLGDDKVFGGNGADSLFGNEGNDTLVGGRSASSDTLHGDEGDDVVLGQEGEDLLFGGAGNDRVSGGSQIDCLYGGEGSDTLIAGGGRDTLFGGAGDDILIGDGQADLFVFFDNFGDDVILDFAALAGAEKLQLGGVTAITDFNDLQQNHLTQVGNDAVISDGAGNTITLKNVNIADLDASDFDFTPGFTDTVVGEMPGSTTAAAGDLALAIERAVETVVEAGGPAASDVPVDDAFVNGLIMEATYDIDAIA